MNCLSELIHGLHATGATSLGIFSWNYFGLLWNFGIGYANSLSVFAVTLHLPRLWISDYVLDYLRGLCALNLYCDLDYTLDLPWNVL